jgi:multidrug efflux pump subunit AcrB
VFVPMFTLGGVAGYLFRPMAEAVVFALVGSFMLSRTLVPTLANYLLAAQERREGSTTEAPAHNGPSQHRGWWQRVMAPWFEARFDGIRQRYQSLLSLVLEYPKTFIAGFLIFVILSLGLTPFLGETFFPSVESNQIMMHVRAQTGTRVEETARLCDLIERYIRQQLPPEQIENFVDNIDLPVSGINMAYSNTGTIGPEDADILLTLKGDYPSTHALIKKLRLDLPKQFPGNTFYFPPADITTQVLNFGDPAPLDVKIIGQDREGGHAYAHKLLKRMREIPGIVDARIQQRIDYPQINVDVDRSLAGIVGPTERDVANSLLTTLGGSIQVHPNFWLDDKTGVSYPLVVQMPQYNIDSISDLVNVPITSANGKGSQYLGGLAAIHEGPSPGVESHYNVEPSFDIYAAVQDRDLGGVVRDVNRALAETHGEVPNGSRVLLRGQVQTMRTAYDQLYLGLAGAIVLVYLVIVVNFQSWLDPFVIITALPGALAGIVWMLFLTGTYLSVPALTGAIMCMGVATANSILVVSFARESLAQGMDAAAAALDAGVTRFRPVLMTALAMIIGMLPMALALGEGGEQNAPLGRAVIGGLTLATAATLFLVPTIFAVLHGFLAARSGNGESVGEPTRAER